MTAGWLARWNGVMVCPSSHAAACRRMSQPLETRGSRCRRVRYFTAGTKRKSPSRVNG